MDLDKIKESWKQAKLEPGIGDEKIHKMLDNKGKSAFSLLYKYEMTGLIISLLCIPLAIYLFDEIITSIFFIFTVLFLIAWQFYKVRFLSKINISYMGMLDLSLCIVKYRRLVYRELIGIIIWITVFCTLTYIVLIYVRLGELLPTSFLVVTGLIFLALIIGGILLSVFLYKIVYIKNIRKIEDSIREIEDFERDNHD